MSKVYYLDPIDYISGKIARKFRTIYCHRTESDKRYTTVRSNRTTPLSSEETIARELFKARAAWVTNRSQNLASLAQDQEDFLAQKNLANGAKTMKAFYWKLAKTQVTAQTLNG